MSLQNTGKMRRKIEEMKALVFNPHDDDGVIAMGGTLIQLLDKGWKIGYIQFTDGRHGSNIMSPEKTNRVRALEAKEERKFLGIDYFHAFDVEDGILEKITSSEKERIIDKLSSIIKRYKPNVIFLPNKAEGHPDHKATYQIGREAIEKSGLKPLEMYYIVWLFPFFKQDPGYFEKVLWIPIDNQFERKKQAIKLHTSQEEEGRYSELAEAINTYLSLLYLAYRKRVCSKAEVVAIYKMNEHYESFVNSLERVKDVTRVFLGRKEKKIER